MTTELDHADIRWRVSNTWEKNGTKMGMLVGYIDARTAMDALDMLDPEWSAVHGAPIIVGSELIGVPCAITVNGVTRSDVGMPSSQEPIKGAYSDALKRAAVHFGIGRELYELPKIAVECEVVNGKVRGPKALPVYRKGRWEIDRQYGWVKYEREPEDQPEQRGGKKPSSPSAAPVQRTAEEQALLDYILAIPGMTHARMRLMADGVGVPKGGRANAVQLRAMIAYLEQPGSGVPSAPAGGGVSSDPAADNAMSEGSPDSSGSDAATPAEAVPPPSQSAAPNDLMDDILNVTGGEDVTPEPGTVQDAILRAEAKAAKAKVRA
jgi:hypothetical protein